jgi:DNA-binding MurR/RpiR family transcriptional regulator
MQPESSNLHHRRATQALGLPVGVALNALESMARGLTAIRAVSTSSNSHSPAEPVALGQDLAQWIRDDLLLLKPKMRRVAEQLLLQHTTLHQQGILNLAHQTNTAPATIVRLAKRYGFAGFSDLKLAFLQPPSDQAMHSDLRTVRVGPRYSAFGANVATTLPPRLFGTELIARIYRDLPLLSPKMRNVGEHLVRNSSLLHQQRIQELARQSNTIPATVVRLAKRYGFIGFHDLKLAFLPSEQKATRTSPLCIVSPTESQPGPEITAAFAAIDLQAGRIQAIRPLLEQECFQQLLRALHAANHISVCAAKATDQVAADYFADRLATLKPYTTMSSAHYCEYPAPRTTNQPVVLEICLAGKPTASTAATDHKGFIPNPWITVQQAGNQTHACTPSDTNSLEITLPGETDTFAHHCAFALADAVCAALHTYAQLHAPISLPTTEAVHVDG